MRKYLVPLLFASACGGPTVTVTDAAVDTITSASADMTRLNDISIATQDLTTTVTGDMTTTVTGDMATTAKKRIFITAALYKGDLKTIGGGTDGLNGADKLCQASSGALGGTWKAWLSDETTDALSRIADVGPWFLPDGTTKVFDNKAAMAGLPLVKIDRTEMNMQVTSFPGIAPWTGTKLGGTKTAGLTCSSWTTSTTGDGTCGRASVNIDAQWTDAGGLPCSIPYPLYCVEQ